MKPFCKHLLMFAMLCTSLWTVVSSSPISTSFVKIISPVSIPSSIYIVVIPVVLSPLSIAHCIYSAKSYGKNIYLQDLEKENEAYIKHNIGFDNFRLNDTSVTQSDYLDVTVIEYAPKIFAYLRNLEHINIDEMADSFLPKNNRQGISESQGKSGSFFISTDDNQYMIQTLRVDDFDLIRKIKDLGICPSPIFVKIII